MDWLTFIAALVESLAWPAAIVGIVFLLRKPLRGLIPLLHRLKYKDLELEFERQVNEVSEALAAEPVSPGKALPPAEESAALELAPISPRAAVLEAWREIEHELEAAVRRNSSAFGGRTVRAPHLAIRMLQDAKILDEEKAWMLQRMRALRNGAAHLADFALGTDAAIEYVTTAARLRQYLETL